MEKTFDTKFGEVTVRTVMFDTDGTNLQEGIEIEGDNIEFIEIYDYYDLEDMQNDDVERLIDENS